MKIILTFTLLMIPGVVRSMSVTGYSGSEVNITCKYSKGDTAKAKYFCRGKKPNKPKSGRCSELIRTNENEKDKWVHSGRFSLYDDTRSAVFTLTIRNLSELDSGMYQCGVDRIRGRDSYTEVNLKVTTETDYHRTTSSSSSSSSSSVSVKSPEISSVSPGSSLVVSVSVVLLLIIIGLVFVIWTVCRRRQSNNADSSSKRSHATSANNEEVSHTGFDYKIKETHRHLLTNPSDSSICVYDTVEKATASQLCITSAEDLNYTVVNFHQIFRLS
ncbi:CMRF35-like molecule 6 [Megalobrama amblycephala]|uniref:CMRF35-like molecule 6 n=1 Tax=Megalobrama amblycephala TaxID=75352 RepID=UPI002014482D|nr:CMRF35-like molecule 6 [Megalobrama amblycephala]